MTEKLCNCLDLDDKDTLMHALSDIQEYLNDDIKEFNDILTEVKMLNIEDRELIEENLEEKNMLLNEVKSVFDKVKNTPMCK